MADFGNVGYTAQTSWQSSGGYFIPGDVSISVNISTTYGDGNYSYSGKEGVWGHEMGHTLGLAHNTTNQGALMWPYDNRWYDTPQSDDINGGEAIYG